MNLHLIIRQSSTIVFFSESISPDMLTLVDAVGFHIDADRNVSALDGCDQDLITPDLVRELLNVVDRARRERCHNRFVIAEAPVFAEIYDFTVRGIFAKDITK